MALSETHAKKAGFTVAAMVAATLFAKLLGMARQILIAGIFADSLEGVAFAAASKIPFAIFDMLFSAAVLGSFIPIYRGALSSQPERARKFSSSFFAGIAVLTAGTAVLGMIFAREILFLSAPNLDDKTAALAADLLRIMFPAMIFAGAAYTLIGILQSHESFILPSLVSAVSNLVIIAALLFYRNADRTSAVYGLSAAYLVSWAVQFLTMAVPLLRRHRFPRPAADFKNPDLRLSVKRSLPVMLGSWLIPVGTLTATFFSSYIPAQTSGAAIVIFDYAFSVYSIIAGVLTYGVCNYIFPKLSEKAALGDTEGFSASVRGGLFAALALILPAAAGTFILSEDGIRLLYLHGDFTEELTAAVSGSLRMLTLAMPAYCVIELLSRVFYSCGKVRYPMYAAVCGMLTGFLCSLVLLLSDSLTTAGAALSIALGQITAAAALFFFCRRAIPGIFPRRGLSKAVWTSLSFLASAAVMAAVHHLLSKKFVNFGAFGNFLVIAIVFLAGVVVYLICMIVTKTIAYPRLGQNRGEADGGRR